MTDLLLVGFGKTSLVANRTVVGILGGVDDLTARQVLRKQGLETLDGFFSAMFCVKKILIIITPE